MRNSLKTVENIEQINQKIGREIEALVEQKEKMIKIFNELKEDLNKTE
jgi:uncharacterized protein YoxC